MEKIVHKRSLRKWNEEKISFLKDNYKTLSYREISDKLGMTYSAISHKAHRLGLDSRDLWTEEENLIILNEYSCNPDIWTRLKGRSREAIKLQARKLGAVRECGNYKINYKFFEEWTPESAYVIGFFLADGCVEPHLNRISCELSMKDYDHLVNIRNLMGSENPICIKKTKHACSLYIHNKKMVMDIISKGVIPNKTTRVRLPDVPKEYLRDLIRGYFDGDGSFWYKDIYLNCQFLGNLGFVSDIEKIFSSIGCSKRKFYIHNKGSENCYAIHYSSKEDIIKVINFMYYEGCFNLKRKMGLARGETPGIIKSAQISQAISSSNREPERKTSSDTRLACRDRTLTSTIVDDGTVQ